MSYLHVEIESCQVSKRINKPCGDVFDISRCDSATTIILSDGLGSGIKANIAANMCVSRLKEMLNLGFSIHKAVSSVVKTMIEAIRLSLPYAVFTVVRIQNDGFATILTYDMPQVIFLTNKYSTVLEQRKYLDGEAMIAESNCYLKPREAILLMSDGVSQAGLGVCFAQGWGIENINKFITNCINQGIPHREIPQLLYNKSYEYSGMTNGDDISAVLAVTRLGVVVNVWSGPPEGMDKNHEIAINFINLKGIKIICGATTSKIFSNELHRAVRFDDNYQDAMTPPASFIDGIDLVTEGLITLNQLFNILDEDRAEMKDTNPATKLYDYFILADKINFFVGMGVNTANQDLSYKQRGLIPRKKIINLIASKLEQLGKLVVIHEI